MIGYVYLWINKINNKKYVGITTKTCEERWKQEYYYSQNKDSDAYNYILSNAIRKYGINNFDRTEIDKVESDTLNELITRLNELEQFYIWYYESFADWGKGYNATTGGDNNILCEETRRKQSIGQTAAWADPDRKPRRDYSGTNNPYPTTAVLCIEESKYYNTLKEVQDDKNISRYNVSACCAGRRKTAGGFHWCLANENLTIEEAEQKYFNLRASQ